MSYTKEDTQPILLILRALALGDLLTVLPALRALKKAFPAHRRILTCPVWLKPLAQWIDAADNFIEGAYFSEDYQAGGPYQVPTDLQLRIELEKAQLNGLAGISKEPDIAVNLRGERTATHQVLLRLRPHRYIGFRNADIPETAANPIWQPDEAEVARWCRLLQESGISSDPDDLHFLPPVSNITHKASGATVIHPGAGSPARYWPIERWATVAQWEMQRGNKVILTGSLPELEMVSKVAELAGLPPESIYAGRTDILDLAALCGVARKIVCTDTGIAHLAVGLRIPTVVLFGPTPPSRWGPPGHLPQHRVLWAGFTGEPYASKPDSGLLKIQVEEVLAEIIKLEDMDF